MRPSQPSAPHARRRSQRYAPHMLYTRAYLYAPHMKHHALCTRTCIHMHMRMHIHMPMTCVSVQRLLSDCRRTCEAARTYRAPSSERTIKCPAAAASLAARIHCHVAAPHPHSRRN